MQKKKTHFRQNNYFYNKNFGLCTKKKKYIFYSLQSLVLLANNIVAFSAFELQFIVSLFSGDLVCASTNNSFRAFEATARLCWAFSTLSFRETSLLIILICNPFELQYCRSIACIPYKCKSIQGPSLHFYFCRLLTTNLQHQLPLLCDHAFVTFTFLCTVDTITAFFLPAQIFSYQCRRKA